MKKILSVLLCVAAAGVMLSCSGGSSKSSAASSAAAAVEDWKPTKEVEYVIPASAGGGSDLWARACSNAITVNKLSEYMFVPTNKAGGASAVGYNYMLSKKGDAHTILALHSGALVSTYVAGWDHTFESYLEPIVILAYDDVLLCTLKIGPYNDIQSLLKAAKDNPGTIRFGSDQRLNSSQYAFEMLKKEAGADMNYVQFDSSGDAATALLGGHVDVAILNPGECVGQVTAGTFTPVVTFATERLKGKFDAPTFAEIGYPNITMREFRGIAGTVNMPLAAKKYYEEMGKKLMETQEFKNYINSNGLTPTFMGIDEAPAYATGEMKKIAALFAEVTKK